MTEESTPPLPPEPSPAQAEGPASAHERAKASQLKHPSGPHKAAYRLLSRETRAGRFLRRLLWALVASVGLAAAGALAVYLLLSRPLEQQLQQARLQATQSAEQLAQAQQELSGARQALQSAQSQEKDAQTRLDTELIRAEGLRVMQRVTLARLALANQDQAGAAQALDQAQARLKNIEPQLQKLDATQAATLQALFTLARTDLGRDVKLADQDLERLTSELERLDQSLQ